MLEQLPSAGAEPGPAAEDARTGEGGAAGRRCSVGIMAYNEAANIANAIESLLAQEVRLGGIDELIVVASGCTDDTVPIVARLAEQDARVRLIEQPRREGKASAINLFIAAARSPILLMASADVLIKPGTLDAMLGHFLNPKVGMVGAHPIPVNDDNRFLGHAVHLLWQMHDCVARETAKLGEVVAFRNVIPGIALDTPVDEISIQALITQLGYDLVYEPDAIVYNRGPSTVGDFLRQRRRIYAGHLRIEQQQGYSAATMDLGRLARTLFAVHPFGSPRQAVWTLGTVGLEGWSRVLGAYDNARRRPHQVWQMATTTKAHIGEVAEPGHQSVLVFRIVGFHRHEIELGSRAGGLLLQAVAQHIRGALGPDASVTSQRGGTVIAILPREREAAEGLAQALISEIEATRFRVNGHADGVPVKLACGIIAFMQTGHAQVLSLPATV